MGTNVTVTGYQIDLTNTGTFTSTTPSTSDITVSNIPADGQVKVRVTATVNPNLAPGTTVAVQLGNTTPNDNSAATQNQLYSANTGPTDVNTVSGTSVNGKREASATESTTVSAAVTPLALARVEKTLATYTPNGFTGKLTYRLDLTVQNTSPNTSYTPADLKGHLPASQITGLTTSLTNLILVSDNIPANSTFDSSLTPVTPTGWTVIYSTDISKTPLNDTTWTTTQPTTASSIKRIGWVYTGGTGVLAAGTTTTSSNGFQFRVQSTLSAAGQIDNIAQAFGETVGVPGTIVYDESGDKNPDNFNDDTTPPTTPYGNSDANSTDRGVADPSTQGTDTNNNNTGTGPGGEVNTQAITAPGILNGPRNVPAAVGPTNNNDDFQNKATLTEGGTQKTPTRDGSTTINPDPVTFNNTFANSASTGAKLDTVRLLPLPPNSGDIPTASQQANATDIPDGTQVTIAVSNGSTAKYSYTSGGGWVYVAGSGSGASFDATAKTLVFNNVQPGNSIDYTVQVDLPAGTDFSEKRFAASGIKEAGFNVPIVAFVDNDNNGAFSSTNDNVYNITIDRVYTGYMILLKEVRIIDKDGTSVLSPTIAAAADGSGTVITPGSGNNYGYAGTINSSLVVPGRILEYRISYMNFSSTPTNSGSGTASAASGNTILDASNFTITEDGTVSPNNWATYTTHRVGTTVTTGSVQYFNAVSSLGTTDPSTGATVTKYVNSVGTVSPTTSSAASAATQTDYAGNMTFKRTIN